MEIGSCADATVGHWDAQCGDVVIGKWEDEVAGKVHKVQGSKRDDMELGDTLYRKISQTTHTVHICRTPSYLLGRIPGPDGSQAWKE